MNSLGQRIRDLRIKRGLTQIDLSRGICTPSMISQIEADRARPSYKVLFGIAERLEIPLDKLLLNVDLHLESLSNYKMACAMIRAKEYGAAIPLLQDLLDTGRGQITSMDIQMELGEFYLQTGQLDEAETSFAQLYELATRRQAGTHLICQLLKNLGIIALRRKQYQLAICKFQRALEEFENSELMDSILKAVILFQIGQTYSILGQVEEAVKHYKQAASLYEQAEHPQALARSYMGIGQALVKLADYETAIEYSDRAIALFDAAEDMYMSLKTQVLCAVNQGLSGEWQQAIPKLERLITKFQDLQRTQDVGITYVELAKVHLYHGQLEQAEEACLLARTLLPEIHVCRAWISRIHGHIAIKRDQPQQAMRLFNRAADCFLHHGELGEWERSMYDLARLHFDAGNCARAFGIMEEIRRQIYTTLENRGIAL